MAAYFKDIRSNVVLKFVHDIDIKGLREQTVDYKEVTEQDFNEYKGIQPKKAEKPSK